MTARGAHRALKRAVMAGPQVSRVSALIRHFGGRSTMTRYHPTPSDTALVAIDVAKRRNEVLIELPGRGRRRRLTVLNTREAHDLFIQTLSGLGHPIVAGFEATGNHYLTGGIQGRPGPQTALPTAPARPDDSSSFGHQWINIQRLCSSKMVSSRKALPSWVRSCMKS